MYRKVLSDDPKTDSDLLAEAISLSQLVPKEKLAALLEGATSAVFEHRRAALSHMKKVDEGRFKQIIKNQLRELSARPAKHSERDGNIAYLVIAAEDPGLWKALTSAAHRADSNFKSDAMWAMCNAWPQETQRAQRAQFLESFLNDQSEVDPKRFSTPLSSQSEIRNLAAEHLGHRVGISRSKESDWSADHWKQFRAQVRKELKRKLRESVR
jgi:protein required for attachment to host cells